MRKRFFLAATLMLLVVFCVHSQDRSIGLSIKPLVSGVSNTNNWTVSNRYRIGWQINGEYSTSISKNIDFSIGTGLAFWQVGFEDWATWPSMLSSTSYEKIQIKEVVFPLDVSLNLKDAKFFLTTGVMPTFVLSAVHPYNYFEPQVNEPWRSVKLEATEYAAFNVAVKAGIGVRLFTTQKISWVISPEIQTYVLRDTPKSFMWFTSAKIRRWSLGVKLGVQYRLKAKKILRTLG